MLYDVEKRGRTEVEAINDLVELAERFGIDASTNRMPT